MSETSLGNHGRMEIFRDREALREYAEAFVRHPRSPEGPGLPQGRA